MHYKTHTRVYPIRNKRNNIRAAAITAVNKILYIIPRYIHIFYTYCYRGHDERAGTVFVGLSEKNMFRKFARAHLCTRGGADGGRAQKIDGGRRGEEASSLGAQ